MSSSTSNAEVDVLVIGAGMAGLTAARALAEWGFRVCVLEAKERVGGRVMSQRVEGGGIAELGAEFVHGLAPELWALIDEVGAKTVERDGSNLREKGDGSLVGDNSDDDLMFAPLEQLKEFEGEDEAFAAWLKTSDVDQDARLAVTGYVEGFNAADARRISVRSLGAQQKAEDASDGDRSWHVLGGYAQLPEYLAARVQELGGEVQLGCEVLAIRWSSQRVSVETTCGEFKAKQCVVTLPLSLVQRVNRAGGIKMEPEPPAITEARRLEMGHASHFTMMFHERWWERSSVLDRETLQSMSFLFTPSRTPSVWWTSHPEPEALPALTGWVGGPRALALEGGSADQLGRDASELLANVFAVDIEFVRAALAATYAHDWATDPFALGSYSYVPVGAMDASAAMTEPAGETVFFAGEHTDVTGNWGTVQAAIRSGLRAAAQILNEV
jgi:monoamine oxidase